MINDYLNKYPRIISKNHNLGYATQTNSLGKKGLLIHEKRFSCFITELLLSTYVTMCCGRRVSPKLCKSNITGKTLQSIRLIP